MDTARENNAKLRVEPGFGAATYRIALGWRLAAMGVYAVIAAGALAGVCGMLFGATPSAATTLGIALLAGLLALATWAVLVMVKWSVTLSSDAIVASGLWRTRQLGRSEIAGVRLRRSGRAGSNLTLVSARTDRKSISLPLRYMQKDAELEAWLSGLRDLDAEDLQKSLAAIAADPRFGTTPEQRLQRLASTRKLSKVCGWGVVAALAWCLVRPQPYPLVMAVLAAMPLLALVLVVASRGLFRIAPGGSEANPNLGRLFFLPGLGLGVRVLIDFNLLAWMPVVVAGAGVGLLLLAAAALVDRSVRARPWPLLGYAILTVAYGVGAVAPGNALLDRSPVSVFRGQVIGKSVSHGKITRYFLRLGPWGPLPESADAIVPHALYDKLQPGNPACILLSQGALHVPWFIVVECKGAARAQ